MPSRVLGLVVVLVLTSPAAAHAAAMRFASPGGSAANAPCADAAHSCDVVTAINGAADGDTVSLAAGDYGSAASPITPTLTDNGHRLTIVGVTHPVADRRVPSRPVLHVANASSVAVALSGTGTSLTDLDIESASATGALGATPPGAGTGAPITLTRLTVHETSGFLACIFDNALPFVVVDTVCIADRAGGQAITTQANNVTLRNVTAVAPEGVGLISSNTASGSDTITAVNSIFDGGTTDVTAAATAPGLVTLSLTNCNDSTVNNVGGDADVQQAGRQTDAPHYADASAADYHEALGSPTIDAGVDSPANGPTDLDGAARILGARTDIGAYESASPQPITGAADGIGQTVARIHGTVNPRGQPATWRIEYGDSTGYGHLTAPTSAGRGITPVPVVAMLSGLIPGVTYHYRVLAVSDATTVAGADATFRTPSPSSPTPSRLTIATSRAKASRTGRVTLRLACRGGTQACQGALTLTARGRLLLRRGHRGPLATVRLARAKFTIAAGGTASVSLRLERAGRSLLAAASHRRLRATAEAGTATRRITLTGPRALH